MQPLCERDIFLSATSWVQSSPGMAATKVLKGSFTATAAPLGIQRIKKSFDGKKSEQEGYNSPAK